MSEVAEDVSLNILEEAEETSRNKENLAFELPPGGFEDGLLGITDEAAIDALRESLVGEEHFCDDDFPADNSSLYFRERSKSDIVWKRPFELVPEPTLFVDRASRRDVVQGCVGNCWFLSACAAVARKSKLIERVIPPNQRLHGANYTGLIKCRFWRFGEWVSVYVDDRLPTKDGELFFGRSSDPNEFWIALLEKAYAKLHGSYEAIDGGQSMDGMVDLTGGLAERYFMERTKDKAHLYKLLIKSLNHGALITASRKGDWRMATGVDEYGLVDGHVYTVSAITSVQHTTLGSVNLIRLRNPWANDAEWNGEWADGDDKWNGISEIHKEKLEVSSLADGEFWMSFDDFCLQFEDVSVCTVGPDFDQDGTVDQVGHVKAIRGEWAVGSSAGGGRRIFKKFATNPQFLLTVKETDVDNDNRSSLLVGVLQEHRRSKRNIGLTMIQIAFFIYRTEDPENRLPETHPFGDDHVKATSGAYINFREVLARQELESGHYVIIPATLNPNTPGNFMIRVYSPNAFELKELR